MKEASPEEVRLRHHASYESGADRPAEQSQRERHRRFAIAPLLSSILKYAVQTSCKARLMIPGQNERVQVSMAAVLYGMDSQCRDTAASMVMSILKRHDSHPGRPAAVRSDRQGQGPAEGSHSRAHAPSHPGPGQHGGQVGHHRTCQPTV